MGGKDAPDPPDYAAAAEQQADASREITTQQTWANRPTQNTPWGTVSWDTGSGIDPATGQRITQWTQNMELSPELQSALDAQFGIQEGRSNLALGMLDRVQDEFGNTVDFGSYNPLSTGPEAGEYGRPDIQRSLDFSGAPEIGDPRELRARAEQAAYESMTSRLDPQFADRAEDMDVRLRNQGLRPGDAAYDRAMRNEAFARNDAYSQAMRGAIDVGRAEADQLFGQDVTRRGVATGEETAMGGFFNQAADQALRSDLAAGSQEFREGTAAAGFGNQVRQQQIAEEMQRRGYSLNEINAILTGQQVAQPNMPGFNTAAASETPQYLAAAGMQYNADLNQFGANQAAMQGMLSGITSAGLGAAGLFV